METSLRPIAWLFSKMVHSPSLVHEISIVSLDPCARGLGWTEVNWGLPAHAGLASRPRRRVPRVRVMMAPLCAVHGSSRVHAKQSFSGAGVAGQIVSGTQSL